MRDSRTVLILRVEAVDAGTIKFKVITALKGKAGEAAVSGPLLVRE